MKIIVGIPLSCVLHKHNVANLETCFETARVWPDIEYEFERQPHDAGTGWKRHSQTRSSQANIVWLISVLHQPLPTRPPQMLEVVSHFINTERNRQQHKGQTLVHLSLSYDTIQYSYTQPILFQYHIMFHIRHKLYCIHMYESTSIS